MHQYCIEMLQLSSILILYFPRGHWSRMEWIVSGILYWGDYITYKYSMLWINKRTMENVLASLSAVYIVKVVSTSMLSAFV